MRASTTWDALAQLRWGGQRPTLPVIITTHAKLCRSLEGAGCLTILHERGTKMPVKLLDGIDVILFIDRCDQSCAVKRLLDKHGVKPTSLRAWCECARGLTSTPFACEQYGDFVKWAGGD